MPTWAGPFSSVTARPIIFPHGFVQLGSKRRGHAMQYQSPLWLSLHSLIPRIIHARSSRSEYWKDILYGLQSTCSVLGFHSSISNTAHVNFEYQDILCHLDETGSVIHKLGVDTVGASCGNKHLFNTHPREHTSPWGLRT